MQPRHPSRQKSLNELNFEHVKDQLDKHQPKSAKSIEPIVTKKTIKNRSTIRDPVRLPRYLNLVVHLSTANTSLTRSKPRF